jgi:nicotianamine synthase
MTDSVLFKTILSLPSLRPSPQTNEAFSQLVCFCLQAEPSDITLKKTAIRKLRTLSSKAESEMEAYWAKQIISSQEPNKTMLTFWYYQNYVELVNLEHSYFSKLLKDKKRVLFLGGGPLPLTAILLAQQYGLTCTVIENNKKSYSLACKVIASLGLESMISIVYEDARTFTAYDSFDLVYIAALVGMTESSKHEIILSVHQKLNPGALLMCRSAQGAKTLLYPPVPNKTITALSPVFHINPTSSIINSFVILQKT